MSMRLKKASSFKPKGPGRRGPSTAPSSTRPSAERQSQTPVPAPCPIETITTSNEAFPAASATESTPRLDPAIHTPTPSHPAEGTESLKRKEGAVGDGFGTPDKRTRLDSGSTTATLLAEKIESSKRKERVDDTRIEISEKRIRLDPNLSRSNNLQNVIEAQGSSAPVDTSELPPRARDQRDSASPLPELASLLAHPSIPDVRQDNPESLYPDPELSGQSLPRGQDASSVEPQVAHVVPTATLNPDGTASTGVDRVQDAVLNTDGTSNSGVIPPTPQAAGQASKKRAAPKIPRKPRKSAKSAAQILDGDEDGNLGDMRATIEMNINARRERLEGKKRARKEKGPKKERKKRGKTPEDGENIEVNPEEMQMFELCADQKIGRKFYMADEIEAREEAKKQADKLRRLKKLHPGLASAIEGDESESGRAEGETWDAAPAAPAAPPAVPTSSTPQLRRDANGKFVLDEGTFHLDLHQQAEAERGDLAVDVVEENDFTKKVTCASHLNRRVFEEWNAEDTETFYTAVRAFGQDCDLIAALLPNRDRHQVKLKGEWENRINHRKYTRAVRGLDAKEAVNLEEKYLVKIEENLGYKMEDAAIIEAELKASAEKLAAQERDKLAEKQEEVRKLKAKIKARSKFSQNTLEKQDDPDNEGGEASAAPKPQKKAGPRSRKNPHSSGAAGVEEIVLQSIET
jgi:hypothetical protein